MMADAGSERTIRIDLATTQEFEIGGLRVRPARRQVCAGGEDCREIEPRVMQVLVALASARGEVVSRDRLIETCWDGRIVGDDSINRCIVALRHLAKDFDPQPFVIETVPRIGYSLVARDQPAASANPQTPAVPRSPDPQPQSIGVAASAKKVGRAWALAIGAAALAVVLAVGLLTWRADQAVGAAPATIAVLPFRNLASSDPYFAEGVGEEILGQLSREPQFRVAGRTSSAMFTEATDPREIGRKLDVAYVLEGSVRSQEDRVRVNVALIQASDGMQLWSESYDGSLDDIFAIQQAIGTATAGALKRKLVHARALSGALVTSGDVYSLYLTARGLILSRDPTKVDAAVDLLRRAIKLDPGYAPAWSSLGAAISIGGSFEDEQLLAKQQQAARYIRHALRLAPNLAEAHGALGMVLGFRSAEAVAHIRRAAQLDPGSAENLFWLSNIYGGELDFERQLALIRRAAEIDPLWINVNRGGGGLLQEMGHRDEALAWQRRFGASFPHGGRIMRAMIAYRDGDFSEAARRLADAAEQGPPYWRPFTRQMADEAMHMLGLREEIRWSGKPNQAALRFVMREPPSADEWRARNSDQVVAYIHGHYNLVAAKLLLNAGRHRELADYYHKDRGLLTLRPNERPRPAVLVEAAPLVALALRGSGRVGEADRLLAEADKAVAAALRRGRVPTSFLADAARLWAVQGRSDQALTALEKASGRGWLNSGFTDLLDLADEPAFRSLRGHPRFERIRARIAAHMARERREAQAIAI